MTHGGVWCCTEKIKCQWQCYALHCGLAWGTVPENTEWRRWHDKNCIGKLIQLLPPMPESDPATLSIDNDPDL
jgi:hypothetical protein